MTSVLNILYDERVGGPPLRVLQVARELRNEGFQTVVVIPRGDPTFASLLRGAGISYEELNLVRLRQTLNPAVHTKFLVQFLPNILALRRLIRQHHAEIVHTNGLMNVQAAIAARLAGARLVWHLNDTITPRALRAAFLPLVRAWADRIPVAARAVGRFYFPESGAIDSRQEILYAPVDVHRFHPGVDGSAVGAELGFAEDEIVIGTIGSLSPVRGWQYLLGAAPEIKGRFPSAKFLFVGELLENRQKYWSSLVRETEQLGLKADAFFPGRRSDIPQVLRAMTVYVHPSESEACPMSVLEASASGLPVVATDVGGTRELVEDGVTGILVEPRNSGQIAKAVLRLLDKPELARRIGAAGAERMRRFFSLETCVAEHARIYAAALGHSIQPAQQRAESPLGGRTEEVPDFASKN